MQATSSSSILVQSPTGQLIAAVEVKNRVGLSPKLAALFHRMWLVAGLIPDADFFMLVSEDRGYLWVGRATPGDQDGWRVPDYQFPMRSVVSRYVPRPRSQQRLGREELRLL